MILNEVKMAGTDELINIRINNDKITDVSPSALTVANDEMAFSFDKAIVFPGLINSHDHLDFNLFPQIGDRIYSNYTEWGNYIHKNHKEEIAEVLKIPLQLRAMWGVYKNLLCGVTTVVNHGNKLALKNDLITVFQMTQVLHSVKFEKSWKLKLNNPFKTKLPVTIHVGEGDDWPSYEEIDQLTRWNLFQKKLVGVHAVAMSEEQAIKFLAVVWCPQSNYFLLNKTARVNLLKKNTGILFGTDSTLTSSWDIWDHLRMARKTHLLDDHKLYLALNQNAAKTWQLNTGEIAPGKDADLVVARKKSATTGFDSFFSICPADLLLVIHRGNIRMFDETLLAQLKGIYTNNFSKVQIDGAIKYVQGDLPGLMQKIRTYNSTIDFRVNIKPITDPL